jgi:hypothetical protein
MQRQVIQHLLSRARANVSRRHGANAETHVSLPLQCLLCGDAAQIGETVHRERVFCLQTCQRSFHGLDMWLALGEPGDGDDDGDGRAGGMKRLRQFTGFSERGVELPDELLCELILLAFESRLDSEQQYDELFEMRTVSPQFQRVIDACVVARIRYLDPLIILQRKAVELAPFTGLVNVTVRYGVSKKTTRMMLQRTLSPRFLRTLAYDMRSARRDNVLLNEQLHRFTGLTKLTLQNSRAGDNGEDDDDEVVDDTLRPLTRLRYLDIRHNHALTDAALERKPHLEVAVFHNMTGLTTVQQCPALHTLVLGYNTPISMTSIAMCESMTTLALGGDVPADFDTTLLARLLALRNLAILNNRRVAVIDETTLAALTELRSLIINRAVQITADALSAAVGLQLLSFEGDTAITMLTPESVAPFAQSLLMFRPYMCLNDVQGDLLAGATATLLNLRALDLSADERGYVRDEHVANLVHLTWLRLRYAMTGVPRHGLTRGVRGTCFASLPNLAGLVLSQCFDVSNENLVQLTQLRELDLSYNTRIEDATLLRMSGLRKLYLRNNKVITMRALMDKPQLVKVYNANAPFIQQGVDEERWLALEQAGVEFDDDLHEDEEMHPSMQFSSAWTALGVTDLLQKYNTIQG